MRHGEAKEKLSNASSARSETAETLRRVEGSLVSEQDPQRRAELEEGHRELKSRLSLWTREEPQLRTAEIDASNVLTTEQATLDELRDRLDRLERQLETYGTSPAK